MFKFKRLSGITIIIKTKNRGDFMDFFGKFGKTMAGVGENIGINTEINKLNNEISKSEEKVNELYYFIGKAYFDRHKEEKDSEEADRIKQINNLLSQIEKDKNKINALKGVVICDNCGSEIPADSSFCIKCGAKIQKKEPQASEEDLLCPNCKKVVKADDVFCGNCGTKLIDEQTLESKAIGSIED